MNEFGTYAGDDGGGDADLVGPGVLLGLRGAEGVVALLVERVYEGALVGDHTLGGAVARVGLTRAEGGSVSGNSGQSREGDSELHDW